MRPTIAAKFARVLSCCLLALPCASAHGEPVEVAGYPPVEHASFHQLVFADDDIDILNNHYPPSGDSGFHAHYRDLFYVVIQPSQSSGQVPGGALRVAPAVPVGTAGYSPTGPGPRIHRVINSEGSDYQIIVVELRRANPAGTAISAREAAPQYVQIFDNPRMRAWRLILAPRQTAPAITQVGKGIRVVVRGGLLKTIVPGFPDQVLALHPADFAVQSPGFTRALRNDGSETIELVEIELK